MLELFAGSYLLVIIVGFCLTISPLLIWKHTKATNYGVQKLIKQQRQLIEALTGQKLEDLEEEVPPHIKHNWPNLSHLGEK